MGATFKYYTFMVLVCFGFFGSLVLQSMMHDFGGFTTLIVLFWTINTTIVRTETMLNWMRSHIHWTDNKTLEYMYYQWVLNKCLFTLFTAATDAIVAVGKVSWGHFIVNQIVLEILLRAECSKRFLCSVGR